MTTDRFIRIQAASEADLPAINELYTHYVYNSHCTFDLEPWSIDKRLAWFRGMSPPWQIFVAREQVALLGYAYSSQLRHRAAYNRSVETTVYVHHEHAGKGIGRQLMQHLLNTLEQQRIHRAFAGVALPNDPSVRLHENVGYKHIGTYGEVGYKFDRYHDVAWYQYSFES